MTQDSKPETFEQKLLALLDEYDLSAHVPDRIVRDYISNCLDGLNEFIQQRAAYLAESEAIRRRQEEEAIDNARE